MSRMPVICSSTHQSDNWFSAIRKVLVPILAAIALLGAANCDSSYSLPVSAADGAPDTTPTSDDAYLTLVDDSLKPLTDQNESGFTILAGPADESIPLLWEFRVVDQGNEPAAGQILQWDFGDLGTAEGDLVTHAYADGGNYVVTVTAVDSAGAVAFHLLGAVRVQAPTALDTTVLRLFFQSSVETGDDSLQFSATARWSALAAGEEIACTWEFADGTILTGESVEHLLADTSPYKVTLSAETSAGRRATYFRYFNLPGYSPTATTTSLTTITDATSTGVPAQRRLYVDAGPDQQVDGEAPVTLAGVGSNGFDSGAVSYSWSQTSGPSVSLSNARRATASFRAPVAAATDTALGFKLTVTASGRTASDTVAVTVLAIPDANTQGLDDLGPPFGMEVKSVTPAAGGLTVTTSGGIFELTATGLLASRSICPATNSVDPRAVARLDFDTPAGEWTATAQDAASCTVTSTSGLKFVIYADSLVEASGATGAPGYTYNSLLDNPPWAKGSGGDWYWNDGDGGSIHLTNPAAPATIEAGADPSRTFHVNLGTTGRSAFGVFPTRPFDFERLYGANARPFYLQAQDQVANPGQFQANGQAYRDRGFGTVLLWSQYYFDDSGEEHDTPRHNAATDEWEYVYAHPAAAQAFIDTIHSTGMKAIAYFHCTRWTLASGRPIAAALPWMRDFQEQHNLDGWYLDGLTGNWWADYAFTKQLRADVGNNGVLILHSSVDPWGGWSGRVFVNLESYFDLTLKGETGGFAILHTPRDLYTRYYASGYGSSQALSLQKLKTWGFGRASINELEKGRALAGLHGAERSALEWLPGYFDNVYGQHYTQRKAAYANGTFDPAPDWPLDWFAELTPAVSNVTTTSATLSWTTPEPATVVVDYLDEQPEYGYAFTIVVPVPGGSVTVPLSTIEQTEPATSHSVVLPDLTPGKNYYAKVRCTGENTGKTYGGFVAFTTASP